jgi:hypothetical protein
MFAQLMEAARTSETLVKFYQTTRYYNPEDSHLNGFDFDLLKIKQTSLVYDPSMFTGTNLYSVLRVIQFIEALSLQVALKVQRL